MKYIKLFETHTDYINDYIGGGVKLPNVSHCIEENEVHYSSNIESFRIFREVFCDNVNETDREMFKNNVISVESYVFKVYWNNPTTYRCSIKFAAGFSDPDSHFDTRINCKVNREITEEQYNQWLTLSDDELLKVALPMFRCQGEAEHTWNKPSGPT